MSVRTVNVTVTGEFVRKDTKNAGVQGEANVTTLHIVMDETWEKYGKRLVWRDATGGNPVAIILYNEITDLASGKDPLVFDTPIPSEPLALSGWCSFTIEGYLSDNPSKVACSVMDQLLVKPNDNTYNPAEPTKSQALQLQAEIEKILPDVTKLVVDALETLEDTEQEISVWEQWDKDRAYRPLNKVAWRGRSYLCKKFHANVDPYVDVANDIQGIEGNFWLLIADKGDRGEQGLQGRMGPPGPQGISGVAVETQGSVAFNVDENGHLLCFYAGEDVPPYFIDEHGHLCYDVGT